MDSLTWAANAESNQRMLISLQYNGRVDGGGGCSKQVSGSQIAAFQPGLDIMIPPTSDQEDGTIPFTLFRCPSFLRAAFARIQLNSLDFCSMTSCVHLAT
jgi:hypothetical protein